MMSSMAFAITTMFFGVAATPGRMIVGATRPPAVAATKVRRVSMGVGPPETRGAASQHRRSPGKCKPAMQLERSKRPETEQEFASALRSAQYIDVYSSVDSKEATLR